ncbi:unnamed protein product [Ambrosiozyma monospora]|uniref:Unnamed protein product n=1 Tax=Ambrosiozyma monospora TaxID=43982 RepID=A0ACB5TJE1_AMBMO|nr:unnamed protein product [Ambrosiozyma monospora]
MADEKRESDSLPSTEKEIKKAGTFDINSISTTQEINLNEKHYGEPRAKPDLPEIAGINPDDLEFIMDKVDALSLEEALEIMRGLLHDHKNDINFAAATYQRMEKLVEGPEAVGLSPADYEYEVKTLRRSFNPC